MHLEFVEPTKRYADSIIPRGGLNAIAIDMVVARIERLLAERGQGSGVGGQGSGPTLEFQGRTMQ